MAALAPGIGKTEMPAAMAAAAIWPPGSAMPGVPASETTAMRAPSLSASVSSSARAALVVHVVADGGGGDAEVVEELLGLAGVLAGDAVDAAQDAKSAQGDVFEVADGSGDEVETGGSGSEGSFSRSVSWSEGIILTNCFLKIACRRIGEHTPRTKARLSLAP